MPIDPRTTKAVVNFFRRVSFAAAKGAVGEVERSATHVAEPLLERAEAFGNMAMETVRAARDVVRAHRAAETDPPKDGDPPR